VDLRGFLLRRTRPRPFVVTAVGGRHTRLAVERLLRLRGWHEALTAGEANMLVLCAPSPHGLDDVMDRLWDQVPGPRARTHIIDANDAGRLLDTAAATLVELELQRDDISARYANAAATDSGHDLHAGHAMSGHDMDAHAGHDMDRHDMDAHPAHDMDEHAGHAMPEHDTGGHAGHDMGGHDMSAHGGHAGHDMGAMQMPGGVAMASRAEDRDGLKLDQLHVTLGPALPDWPAGLVVRLTLQGDVVQEAQVALRTSSGEISPAESPGGAGGHDDQLASCGPVERLDSLQRLLFVAGWPAAGMVARRLRDDLAAGASASNVRDQYRAWSRRVRQSRLLRWSTDGIGLLGGGLPEELRGDATARWKRWLAEVDAALSSADNDPVGTRFWGRNVASAARTALDVLPGLLIGRELAAARLIVASLDPDIDALLAGRHEAMTHG
jgi:hypothetical protein